MPDRCMDGYCKVPEIALSANLKRSVGSPLGVEVDLKSLRMPQQLSVRCSVLDMLLANKCVGATVDKVSK